MRKPQVVVIGSHDDTIENLQIAQQIGKYIALNNWILISGGRRGIMEAASRGAAENNGVVVGITPDADFSTANSYCTIVIPTGIGYARNSINVLAADIVIAIGGRSGTLTEVSYAFQYNKPIICCMFAGGWSSLFADFTEVRDCDRFYRASSIEEVYSIMNMLLG